MLEQFLEFVFLLITSVHIQNDYMFYDVQHTWQFLVEKYKVLHPTDLLLVHSLVGDPRVVSHGDLSLLSRIYNCSQICNSVEFEIFYVKKSTLFWGSKTFSRSGNANTIQILNIENVFPETVNFRITFHQSTLKKLCSRNVLYFYFFNVLPTCNSNKFPGLSSQGRIPNPSELRDRDADQK